MRTKQLPVVGAIIALFFGVRTANRIDQGSHSHPVPIRIEQSHTPKGGRTPSHAVKASAGSGADDCREGAGTEKLRWRVTQQTAQGCSVSLSPMWREICKVNPGHPGEDDLTADKLTEDEFVAHCFGKSYPVTSMMASVPNPRRTHLGLMTDRAIEAIQVAAAEAHFLPLSHYLPWPSAAPGLVAAAEGESAADSLDPGVLVFQNVDPPSEGRRKYLIIFLIPDLPTEGLDREVFANAEAILEKVSPDMSTIEFEGPSFSGSVASLKALDSGLGETKCIHAVSGSITNAEEYTQAKTKCSTTLKVMQTGDREALDAFVRGAAAFGYQCREIAILSEEGTVYGRQDVKRCPQGRIPGRTDETAGLWFLHFPREISKLRNAYGAENIKAATSGDANAQPGLGMQWQDPETGQHDDLQTYGGQQTPLSQETVLSTLSITLKAQGIKALGILATDPMDEAFLIHSIKESSPDVRLFLRDPDLLYLRTPDVGSLNGTLLISNYPLIPQNQFWSSTKDQRERLITFPSAFQEGEYNAFVQLMEDARMEPPGTKMKRLEWRWPAGTEASADASNPDKGKPLWLATIGTAGHYPIKILNYKAAKDVPLGLHSLELGPPQFLPSAFWGLIAVMGILHVFGVWFPKMVPSYFKFDFALRDQSSPVTMVRISCHMIGILTIALAQMILGSAYLFFYGSSAKYAVRAGAVAVVTVFLVGAGIQQLWILYRLHNKVGRREEPDDEATIIRPRRVFQSSAVGMAIMVGAGILWGGMTIQPRFDNAFLHFRDLSLSSGVSPTLPLASVLMVLYFGVWAYLRRLSYWEHRYVEMCKLQLDPVIQQDLSGDVRAIDTCLLGPLENRKWMAGFWLALGMSILAFRPWLTLDMVEPSRVWIFVLFFLGLSLLTLWLNWFRFINIWLHLRNILEHLENLPIRTAFQRLPREKSLPILHWSSSQNSFLLRQVLDRVRALACADASQENIELKDGFESKIDALMKYGVIETEVVEYKKVSGGRSRSSLRSFSRSQEELRTDARDEMTDLIEVLSQRLLGEYWKRGSSGAKQDQDTQADLKYVLAEDIIALPFYAYIRKVIGELRNILFFLGIAVSLLFVALHTYAFRADQAIDWWFFGLFAFMGGGIIIVIAQMERNALLSRLSDGTPGELGTGFYLELVKYGIVPFLTIFGSQVPSISNLVLKWVQPALEALH
jgi:hypothetical protein